MEYIVLILYYVFSLLFMIGNTEWVNFESNRGRIGYAILVLMPFSWAAFPVVLGMHYTINHEK